MFSPKIRLMIGGGFLLATAVYLLFSGLGSYLHIHKFVKSAKKADGFVFHVWEGESAGVHYAAYYFRDEEKRWHKAMGDIGKYPSNFKVDDKVPLLYAPDHPEEAERDSFWILWKRPVVLASLGGLSLLMGAGVMLLARNQ